MSACTHIYICDIVWPENLAVVVFGGLVSLAVYEIIWPEDLLNGKGG